VVLAVLVAPIIRLFTLAEAEVRLTVLSQAEQAEQAVAVLVLDITAYQPYQAQPIEAVAVAVADITQGTAQARAAQV
jgi:hypothetical protein